MTVGNLTLFKMTDQKLDWLSERQAILSQNIANADSPGYRARDLTPLNFKDTLQDAVRLPVAVTEGSHLAGTGPRSEYRIDKKNAKEVYEASPNGNGVVLEEQMVAMQESKLQHDLATNLYSKHITMFKTALGGSGNR